MTASTFTVLLKSRFPEFSWPFLISALRQDPILWDSLENTGLGNRALEELPNQPENWSPAALALLALNAPAHVEKLVSKTGEPLPEELRLQVDQYIQDWQEPAVEVPLTITEAGLFALALQASYLESRDWDKVFASFEIEPSAWQLPTACLYGLVEDSTEFLQSLLKVGEGPHLAVHALLCQPLPPETTLEIFSVLLEPQGFPFQVKTVECLYAQRPELGAALAGRLFNRLAPTAAQQPGTAVSVEHQMQHFSDLVYTSSALRMSNQSNRAIPELAEAMKSIRRMEAQVASQLAQAASEQGDQKTSMEAWKQAAQLAPDTPQYLAGLVNALLDAGLTREARVFLSARQGSAVPSDHPALLMSASRLANTLGKPQTARHLAAQSLTRLDPDYVWLGVDDSAIGEDEVTGSFSPEISDSKENQEPGRTAFGLSGDQLNQLANAFLDLGMPYEAARTASLVLQKSPADQQALYITARAQLELGHPAAALTPAAAALAQASDDLSLRRMFIDSLESVGEWDAALKERLQLLEQVETGKTDIAPDAAVKDLCDLARCALEANQPSQAYRACQVALQYEAQDGNVILLLGKAQLMLGDLSTALEQFKKATELIPGEADAWLQLVRAYQLSDDEFKAVEALRTASQAAPDSAEIQLAMGEAYLAEEAPTQALAAFRKAAALVTSRGLPGKTARHTDLGKDNSALRRRIAYHLGQTLHLLGYLEESKQVLGEAYDDDQHAGAPDPQIAYAYAKTLLSLHTPHAALAPLRVVIQSEPVKPEPYLEYARAILATGNSADSAREARMFLQKVLAITGRSGSIPGEPGDARLALNDTQPLRIGNKAIRDEARALLAESLFRSGDLEEAMQTYRIALETTLAQQTTWRTRLSVGLARTALALGQQETAIAILQETYQADPLSSDIQVVLSEAYLAAGLVEEAYQAAQAARRLSPSDVDTLAWYARQVLTLQSQPRGRQIAAENEAIEALNQATRIAPFRTDLLVEMGQIQLQNGNDHGAHETFARLVLAISSAEQPECSSPVQLYQAARSLRKLGDARRAIMVLEYAASLNHPVATGGVELADLLSELAQAFREDGNHTAALENLNQAIRLKPKAADLYLQKANLLVEMGNHQSALSELQTALQLEPGKAGLYTRTAEVFQSIGDIPAALNYAEQAITVARENSSASTQPSNPNQPDSIEQLALETLSSDAANADPDEQEPAKETHPVIDYESLFSASCLAAHLACSLLDFGRARMLLIAVEQLVFDDRKPAHTGQYPDLVNALCMLAEIEFEEGNVTSAAHALEPLRSRFSNHPRVLSAQSRLAAAQGDVENGARLFEAAMAAQNSGAAPHSYYPLWTLRSLAATALELGQWEIAIPLLESLQNTAESEPLSHLQMARALALRAEAQFVCHELDVVRHSPGEGSLADQAVEQFNQAIEKIQSQNNPLATRARARGLAIFQPGLENAQALEAGANSPDEFAALVTCYGRMGDLAAATRTAQLFPLHPRVQLSLAIALAQSNPRQGYGIASSATAAANQDSAGLELAPLLYNLQARLALISSSGPGESQTALVAIETALRYWPDEPRWHALAARIHLGGTSSGSEPDFTEAIQHLEQATRLEPKYSPHYLALGHIHQANGDLKRAVQAFEQASRLAPDQSAGWIALARAQHLLGDLEQAAASADRAVECDPENIDPLLLRGELALEADNARGAQSRAQAILKIYPDHPQGLYLLARSLSKLERPDESMEILKKAILIAEKPLPLRLEQIRLLGITEGPEAALEALKELAGQYMDEPTVLTPLAHALMEAGQAEDAVQSARLALHANQGDLSIDELARLHFLIGSHLGHSGQLDQAVHHLGEAIQYQPGFMEAYLELGHAQQERRQFAQALNAYQQAIAIAPNDPRPFYQAGLALKENKDYLGAESMLRKAAELAPNEVTIHRLLAAVVALNLVHSRQPTTTL